ncbi:MAG: serine/threonine protein kinase [Bradymonadia bacterium]|jgi:serine/threonine protein kinase
MDALASFGPYTLLRAISATNDSVSFAARFEGRKDTEHILSIKAIDPEVTADAALRERLVDEMRLAVRLNHVNVAQTFDLGQTGDLTYVALEFVDGIPLKMVQAAVAPRQKAVTAEVATFIAVEICAGLAYAHGRRDERGRKLGIVHTRPSPRTVLLSKSGLVKVVNFGLARVVTDVRSAITEDDDLHYLAPEIVRGDAYDRRADVFSVGAIAYQLLTGHRIYEGTQGEGLLKKAQRGYVPAVLDIDPDVPEALALLVDKALAADPEDRIQEATDLRSGLGAWLRRNSPGFGRHRLKSYLHRLLPETTYGLLPDGDWQTLHRKNFRFYDSDSLIADAVESEPDVPTEKHDIRPLMVAPNLPEIIHLDITRMKTGAHATVREQAINVAKHRASQRLPRVPAGQARQVAAPPPVRAIPPGDMPSEAAVSQADPSTEAPDVFAARSYEDAEAPSALDTESGSGVQYGHIEEDTGGPIQIDPDMVYDDSVPDDFGRAAVAAAEADEIISKPGPSLFGVFIGLVLLAGLGFGVKYLVDQASAEPTIEASTTLVFITSRPQGASILVDGLATGTTTPAPLSTLPTGSVSITVELSGFETPVAQTLDATLPPAELSFDLQPAPHTIRVDSDPAGSQVFYLGEQVGVTPVALGPLRVDHRRGVDVVLKLEGYLDEQVSVDWAAGEPESSVRRPMHPDPNYVAPALE